MARDFAVKLEYIERIMSAPEVLLNMRRCQYVEDVLATLNDEGKMVLEECFWKPKRDAELIAKNLNMSVRRLYYVKHEIVERLASGGHDEPRNLICLERRSALQSVLKSVSIV